MAERITVLSAQGPATFSVNLGETPDEMLTSALQLEMQASQYPSNATMQGLTTAALLRHIVNLAKRIEKLEAEGHADRPPSASGASTSNQITVDGGGMEAQHDR